MTPTTYNPEIDEIDAGEMARQPDRAVEKTESPLTGPPGRRRPRKQGDEALLCGLLGGLTIKAAAEAAGMNESTAKRRLKDEAFREILNTRRDQLCQHVADSLSAGCVDAVTTLRQLLHSDDPRVSLSAAKSILESGLRWRTEADMRGRFVDLAKWFETIEPENQEFTAKGQAAHYINR